MTDAEKVTTYILKHPQWSEELAILRNVFLQTELTEEIKWNSPTYTIKGKIVAGFAGFKNHYAIWFHQGVFLKDSAKKLLNAQEGKTKAMRQWRFIKGEPIPENIILEYLQESIENTLSGKEIKVVKGKTVAIPPVLEKAMASNPSLKKAFDLLTPGRQRDYAEHIGSAKREETQLKRLNDAIPMILEGKGLYDKYKNC